MRALRARGGCSPSARPTPSAIAPRASCRAAARAAKVGAMGRGGRHCGEGLGRKEGGSSSSLGGARRGVREAVIWQFRSALRARKSEVAEWLRRLTRIKLEAFAPRAEMLSA